MCSCRLPLTYNLGKLLVVVEPLTFVQVLTGERHIRRYPEPRSVSTLGNMQHSITIGHDA